MPGPLEKSEPIYGWSRRFDDLFLKPQRTFKVHFWDAIENMGLGYRLWRYGKQARRLSKEPFIDPFVDPTPGPVLGVGLGGFGGGSIGRGWRGEFRNFQLLEPGLFNSDPVMTNQFSVYVGKTESQPTFTKVLYPETPSQVPLQSWDWGVNPIDCHYHALYPRAWYTYDQLGQDGTIKLTCKQVSPILPHDYEESSIPAAVFEWTVENALDVTQDVSIMFTYQNGDGSANDAFGGHTASAYRETSNNHTSAGVSMTYRKNQRVPRQADPVSFAVAALEETGVTVSYRTGFIASSTRSAKDLWRDFSQDGKLESRTDEVVSKPNEILACAVTASVTVPANGSKRLVFTLAWDVPKARFGSGRAHYRRYTRFFGSQGGRGQVQKLAHHALCHFPTWNERIDSWQNQVLHRTDLPDWYKSALFNQLSFVSDGGTIWTDKEVPVEEDGKCGWLKIYVKRYVPGSKRYDPYWFVVNELGISYYKNHSVTEPVDIISMKNVMTVSDTSDYDRSNEHGFSLTVSEGGHLRTVCLSANSKREKREWVKVFRLFKRISDEQQQTPLIGRNSIDNLLAVAVPVVQDSHMMDIDTEEKPLSRTSQQHQQHQVKPLSVPVLPTMAASLLPSDIHTGRPDASSTPVHESVGQDFVAASEIGHFAYLESHWYKMYNTFDVHFYASFALALLWPELELSLQTDFARATLIQDEERIPYYGGRGGTMFRTIRGSVPHDLGEPSGDPWHELNSYLIWDVSRWKDLNPKFVLQVYRDYVYTKNIGFIRNVWPAVKEAVDYMLQFDKDGDGMIENEGFPDQTYDAWKVEGVSAYTGGLWLACLSAAREIALLVDEPALAHRYHSTFLKGQEVYETALWNGEYYNYDSSNNAHNDSIMADMLIGHFYAKMSGLEGVVPQKHAAKALQKIFEFNVIKFGNGQRGAVNGMRPNGKIDYASLQSREVWTGTSYALAATMISEGLVYQGMKTAEGVYTSSFSDLGYWFQTPEAWDEDGRYRSLAYMRPLAVWAIQWVLESQVQDVERHIDLPKPHTDI